MEAKKQTKGRQKLAMKKIENERDLVVTFTKRKSGAVKKTSELANLTGADVALICFSPAGKPYCFAQPSVDYFAKRFLNPYSTWWENPYEKMILDSQTKAKISQLYEQLNGLSSQVEAARAEGRRMEETWKGKDISGWWSEKNSEAKMKETKDSYMDLYRRLTDELSARAVRAPSSSSRVVLPCAEHGKLFMDNGYGETGISGGTL